MTGVMEAAMASSSPSPYLKMVSSRDKNMVLLCPRDDLFSKSFFHRCRNKQMNKFVDFNLSISVSSTHRGFRPISPSVSHTQAEVESHESHLENGHAIEAGSEEDAETVGVKIQLQRECSFGQHFLIVGDAPMLGFWDPNNAIPLTWSDGHVWSVDLDIPLGKCIKFKFIMQESTGNIMWQPGPDRILETDKTITLCEDWENPDSRIIIETDSTLNQVQGLGAAPEMAMDTAHQVIPVEPSTTQEPNGYATNVNEVLVYDETVPVLVPGLSRLPTTDTDEEASEDEPESMNLPTTNTDQEASEDEQESMNATVMIASEVDSAMPELPVTPSMPENQVSNEKEQEAAEEQDHQITQPSDINWGNKAMQKLLSIFGIQ